MLVDGNYVDCAVALSGKLFANTQIPCCLWFLSKDRNGKGRFRERRDEVLFIDARRLGSLIPGSRKQKQLSVDETQRIADVYQRFRREALQNEETGFFKVASIEDIQKHKYVLNPGRYVGTEGLEDEDEAFEERFPRLLATLKEQFEEAESLDREILGCLAEVADV